MKNILVLLILLSSVNGLSMGGKKPKPPPPPANPYTGPVWIGPNIGSLDFANLFSEPHLWPAARQRISAIQFYGGLIDYKDSPCPICGPNYFQSFVNVGAFERIKEWGLDIAIEAGAIKPNDCDAIINGNATKNILRNLKSVGLPLRYISLDEPLMAAFEWCKGMSAENAADATARYIKDIYAHARQIQGGAPLSIGLIEPYPYLTANQIINFLDLLAERGAAVTHLHLDIDTWAIRNDGISDVRLTADLQAMRDKCHQLGIPFGILYAGHGTDNLENYRREISEIASKIRGTLGAPDRAVIQSWAQNSAGQNTIPPNLPETNRQSLTGILLDIINQI